MKGRLFLSIKKTVGNVKNKMCQSVYGGRKKPRK